MDVGSVLSFEHNYYFHNRFSISKSKLEKMRHMSTNAIPTLGRFMKSAVLNNVTKKMEVLQVIKKSIYSGNLESSHYFFS